jgi:hypothetical protein
MYSSDVLFLFTCSFQDEADDSLCQAFKRKFDDIDFPNPAKRETEVEKNISDVEEPNLVLYRCAS